MSRYVKLVSLALIAFILCSLTLVSISCRSNSGKNANGTYKISFIYRKPLLDYDILYNLAKEKGFFKKNNVQVDVLKAENKVNELIISGKYDIGGQSISSMQAAYLDGLPAKSVAILYNYDPLSVMVSRFPAGQLDKVKTIGAAKGNPSQMFLAVARDKMGVSNSARYIETGSGDQIKVALLKKKQIDLTTMTSPQSVKTLQAEGGYYFIRRKDVPVFNHKALITTDTTLKEKPEALKRFLKAIYQAMLYIKDNRQDVVTYIQSNYGYSAAESTDAYDNLVKSMNFTLAINKNDLSSYTSIINKITKPSDPNRNLDGFLDTSISKQVVSSVK